MVFPLREIEFSEINNLEIKPEKVEKIKEEKIKPVKEVKEEKIKEVKESFFPAETSSVELIA